MLDALLIVLELRRFFIEELVDRAPATSCCLTLGSIWLIFLH